MIRIGKPRKDVIGSQKPRHKIERERLNTRGIMELKKKICVYVICALLGLCVYLAARAWKLHEEIQDMTKEQKEIIDAMYKMA